MSPSLTPNLSRDSASPILGEGGSLIIRCHHVTNPAEIPTAEVLEPDEAIVVGTFELAETLIAHGIDSAQIAVSSLPSSDPACPGYVRDALSGNLAPLVPFCFNRSSLVILPTYNEQQNLPAMIEAIRTYLATDILVVDDNSPDGTGLLADKLSQQHTSVHVLHRAQKQGLGPAYIAGFQWALTRHYQLIIEMDCDFSHAPWDLPRMVHRSATADLVIGSRYIPGGGTENWTQRRRLVSRLGNAYASMFLGSTLHDWTGGFRCFRRELLAEMNLPAVKAKGYVFQVEMAWRARQTGAVIAELPIRFRDRLRGQSKLGWPTIIEAVKEVPRMYWRQSVYRKYPFQP
ncbi:MAG: polyprenol monophosphomannose synthase [Nitrospira sp.]|nr:polyprenol monophosphomannose synthase [Nitrospira sp.]